MANSNLKPGEAQHPQWAIQLASRPLERPPTCCRPLERPPTYLLRRALSTAGGFTLLELILAITVLTIFTAAAIPIAKNTVKREREIELRRALRELRSAIDRYRQIADAGLIKTSGGGDFTFTPSEQCMGGSLGTGCYPPTLEVLVEGVPLRQGVGKKVVLLREIPCDPMWETTVPCERLSTKERADRWGKRSFKQDPDSWSWDGQNVFDVYSTSQDTALDGTKYRDW